MGFPPPLRNRQITLKSKKEKKRTKSLHSALRCCAIHGPESERVFFCQIEIEEGQFWFAKKMNIFKRVELLLLKKSPLTTIDLATFCVTNRN